MRPSDDSHVPNQLECDRPECPNMREPRSKYCGNCSGSRWKATAKSRQAVKRISQRPNIIAATQTIRSFTEALDLSGSPGAISDAMSESLLQCDQSLALHGPADLEIRSNVRARAGEIRQYLLGKQVKTSTDAHQYVSATAILADVGTEAPTINIPLNGRYAEDVVAFYLEAAKVAPYRFRSDICRRLSGAVMVYANTLRMARNERKAKWWMRFALHILKERCDAKDPGVAVLLQRAIALNLRFFDLTQPIDKIRRAFPQLKETYYRLRQLAAEVDNPSVWLETRRDLVNFWNVCGLPDQAMEEFKELENLRDKHVFPEYGTPCLFRPKIHVLLKTDLYAGLQLIREYHAMYLLDRHQYYFDVLCGWKQKYRELHQLKLPPPTYASVIQVYLPRNKL